MVGNDHLCFLHGWQGRNLVIPMSLGWSNWWKRLSPSWVSQNGKNLGKKRSKKWLGNIFFASFWNTILFSVHYWNTHLTGILKCCEARTLEQMDGGKIWLLSPFDWCLCLLFWLLLSQFWLGFGNNVKINLCVPEGKPHV